MNPSCFGIKLPVDEEQSVKIWIEVASFVDEDELAFFDTGWL